MKKIVDGVEVDVSTEEQLSILAERDVELIKQLKEKYMTQRRAEYGSIEDQLDMIYHEGLDAWKVHIGIVKTKYPKPE